LSPSVPIAFIDIRVFAHATEDLEKVMNAVHNILPTEFIDNVTFKRANLSGHHGNPVVLLKTRIKEKRIALAIFEKLSSGLSIFEKDQLSSEIMQHLEKGNLYMRLDKQAAYHNEFKLNQIDPIHFRVHFKKHSPKEVVEICRKFGLLP
jgi:RNA binding exosome subunit